MTYKFKTRAILPVLTLAAGLPAAASAHDVWITTTGSGAQTQAIVNFGHPDDRSLAYLDKLVALDVVSPSGKTSLRKMKFTQGKSGNAEVWLTPAMAMPTDAALFTAVYDNGYFAQLGDAYYNTNLRLAPQASATMWAPKFTKTLLRAGAYSMIAGHPIELEPVEDPFKLPAGKPLHVKILFKGKPLAGEKIELGDGITPVADKEIPRFTTDANGIATIPVTGHGETLLTVDHSTPGANPAVAKTDFWNASLEYKLP